MIPDTSGVFGEEVHEAEIRCSGQLIETNDNKEVHEEIEESINKFCVDYAKSGKAKCRKCNKPVEKNLLRIGKYVAFKGKIIIHFFHPRCAFASFQKARQLDNVLKDLGELDGVESIADEDREFLVAAIKKGNEEVSNPQSRKAQLPINQLSLVSTECFMSGFSDITYVST